MHAKKLQIGIIGAGAIVLQRHLPALLSMKEVEIVAVSNSTFESSRRFCETHLPHATPMKNWADLIALPDLDIVWIGTTPYLHAPIAISALEAGRHVFCQARMAMNLAEALEMLEASLKRPSQVTMLCPPPCGMKGDRVVSDLLASGELGTLSGFHLRSLSPAFLDPNTPPHWRQRIEWSGLNVLTLGIYAEVLQRWLGPIRAVSAQSFTLHRFRGVEEVRIPDRLDVLVEFESGLRGSLELSGITPGPAIDDLRLDGADASFYYNLSADTLRLTPRSDHQPRPLPIPEEKAIPWSVEHDFIHAVRHPDAPRPHPTFADGVAYMRVVQAVADSIAHGSSRVTL